MKLRLFIGITAPSEWKSALTEFRKNVQGRFSDSFGKWTAESNRHLTVRFFGSVEESQVLSIKKVLEKVAAGEFWITTDPAMLRAYAAERAAYLTALARPAFNADSRALLGINTGPESERADGRLFVAQE